MVKSSLMDLDFDILEVSVTHPGLMESNTWLNVYNFLFNVCFPFWDNNWDHLAIRYHYISVEQLRHSSCFLASLQMSWSYWTALLPIPKIYSKFFFLFYFSFRSFPFFVPSLFSFRFLPFSLAMALPSRLLWSTAYHYLFNRALLW